MHKLFPRLGAMFERTADQGSSHVLVETACPRCADRAVYYEGSDGLDDSDPALPVYTAVRDWFTCATCKMAWSDDRFL